MTGDNRMGIPYIPNERLFKAVSYVLRLIENDKPINTAIKISADYYRVNTADVSKYVRIMAAREKRGINRWRSNEDADY